MYVNTNLAALDAWRNLLTAQNGIQEAIQKLSSGYEINTAADGPAAYAIIQQMQGQVNGLNQANQNAQNGISLVQTALGAVNQIEAILQNMRQLAVQAANGTNTPQEDQDIQQQITQFSDEITQIADTTQFNTLGLLNGCLTNGITLQVGANAGQVVAFAIPTLDAYSLLSASSDFTVINGISTVNVTTQSAASAAIVAIDSAISQVASTAATVGAVQDRLQFIQANLSSAAENLTASQARIQDVDQAQEMTIFSSEQALLQYGTNVLWQANQIPMGLMTLLR